MLTVKIRWRIMDNSACPICKAINGYEWVFEDEVPNSLIHPQYGEVWNIVTGSLAHEHQLHKGSKYGLLSTCRCHFETEWDIHDLAEKIKIMHTAIKDTALLTTAGT